MSTAGGSGGAECAAIFLGTLALICGGVMYGPWLVDHLGLVAAWGAGLAFAPVVLVTAFFALTDRARPYPGFAAPAETVAMREFWARRPVIDEPESEGERPAVSQAPDWAPLLRD